jgi:hypothetical protein
VGDDNDDGSGWRAKTRHGANDRTATLVSVGQLDRLKVGELRMPEVKQVYRQALKLAPYLPLTNPAEGYASAIEAQGKLRGLLLVPVDANGIWWGKDEKGNAYRVKYDDELGLLAGKIV